MSSAAQEASFWSCTDSVLCSITYIVLLSRAVLGESWFFQALTVALQKPVPANPFIALFKHLSKLASKHCSLSFLSLWSEDDDRSLVWALTSIWLFVELPRGTGKLANRPGRLKGWTFFFLEKKENPLAVPGPPRVAQGLRESLAKIIQINVYTGQGKRKP